MYLFCFLLMLDKEWDFSIKDWNCWHIILHYHSRYLKTVIWLGHLYLKVCSVLISVFGISLATMLHVWIPKQNYNFPDFFLLFSHFFFMPHISLNSIKSTWQHQPRCPASDASEWTFNCFASCIRVNCTKNILKKWNWWKLIFRFLCFLLGFH